MVSKSAVIGIDLGSADSYVGFVGKGVVDICQNEVSKRSTPTLVGFTDRERLLGDSALAQIKSNAKNTCRNFKHLLGQKIESPYVEAERFWSTSEIVLADDGHPGYQVRYKGEERVISAAQATAMFLTKLRDVTEKWTQAKVVDCVIGIPAYFSDVHRQALLDAAKIAGVSVLRLMNEHTATALAYGIYRSHHFDPEKPLTVVFCSMGHTIFSVSIVQFVKGKLTVVCEKSDKVGGRDMDECLMREFAAQFKKKVGCDPLSNKKAAFKLEDAVTKTKKILSANSEAAISCECLMEDEDFGSNITRELFEKMCGPMMAKTQAVLDGVKAASGIPVEQIDVVEIVGGASRVPWVKEMCSEAFGGRSLSTTMNADESVARGCALQAAMLSPQYKVRPFKVEDFSPFSVNIGWTGSGSDAQALKEEEADAEMVAAEGEQKSATLFPAKTPMNQVKTLTFYRKRPFDLKAFYAESAELIAGTNKNLGNFTMDLPVQPEAKKIRVKAKLSLHGMLSVEGAQLVEEEEYEETVKEKREIVGDVEMSSSEPEKPENSDKPEKPVPPPEPETKREEEPEESTKEDGEEQDKTDEAENGHEKENEEPKEPMKKFEWVDVVRRKKRTKHTDVAVVASGRPGMSCTDLQAKMDEESAMQADMQDIIETDERRNDLESYIFNMRARIANDGEYGAFVADTDREKFMNSLKQAEDWLDENYDATKVMYIDKLVELKKLGEPIVWRFKEDQIRIEWIQALSGTISNYKMAAEHPGDKYGHICPENLGKIIAECNSITKWLVDSQKQQETLAKYDRPVLICADIERKNQELSRFADEILKEPKPKPVEPIHEEKKTEGVAPETEEMPPKEDAQPADETAEEPTKETLETNNVQVE